MKKKNDEIIEKAKKKIWICAECGKKYKPNLKGVYLSLDEIDEFCEECNKKAMR